jgi:putative ABC transport system ATP-binding protein
MHNNLDQPGTHPAVAITDAVKIYGDGETAVRALDHVNLDLPANTFTAVMGPSGSGKSTLMHCMAGLDSLDHGRIVLAGTDLSSLGDRERTLLRREQVGFVFQSFNLVPALTAEDNIRLPLDLAGRRPDTDWYRHLVDLLGISDRLHHTPAQLSGGQRQRVDIARALVTRPAVAFPDEPTGSLDSTAGGQVLSFLRDAVRDLGQTVVMVTHDAAAASYADRVVFLADGRLVDELTAPTAESVLDRMKHLDARTTEGVH